MRVGGEHAVLGEGLRPLLGVAGVQQLHLLGVELLDLVVQLGPGLGESQGQRAQPGPELDDRRPRSDVGHARDAADRVGISDEVLAQRPARA